MNIAVVCANIGAIDSVKGLPKQNMEYDYHYFHEGNLPYPLPNLDNRLKSKYIKIMMHRFLPQYDAYIWLDGKVQVHENNFVELMTKDLVADSPDQYQLCIFPHPDNRLVYEEMNYIISSMKKGSTYLLSRYGHQQMEKELKFYKDYLISAAPVYATTIFSRFNNDYVNRACEEWWIRTLEFSSFDQAMFSLIAADKLSGDNGKNKKILSYSDFETTFSITKHLI